MLNLAAEINNTLTQILHLSVNVIRDNDGLSIRSRSLLYIQVLVEGLEFVDFVHTAVRKMELTSSNDVRAEYLITAEVHCGGQEK